jgi:aspartyl-tRNA(Asn)/glutamyl-tRNA(Gln) amidotransferase subunit A
MIGGIPALLQAARDFIAGTFEHIDILQLPVLSRPVPTLAETDVKGDASMPSVIASLVRYTRWLSYLGLPALALPAGFVGGLPVAMQLVGRPYSESLLLNAGHIYESLAGTRRNRAPSSTLEPDC